jgi:transcriptional regulator MraZ
MYLGQKHLFVENDRQVKIPDQIRPMLVDGAYITRGFENDLIMMSDQVFQEIYKRVVALNLADPLARLLLRLLLGHASRIGLSNSEHVQIPEDLSSFAGLEKEIIMVGQGDYVELWSPANWEKQTAILLDTEANAERFSHLNLAL